MGGILTIVLAGGKGERLHPLTRDRAKPAVPFGGVYRIIDFTLSNCLHSGLRQILVLTQYKSQSLDRHLRLAWNGFTRQWGEFLEVVPPQQLDGERWYEGTADAVFQNIGAIERVKPDHVLILSGDHVYKMDYRPFLSRHLESSAHVTVACVPVPLADGESFGVMSVDPEGVIHHFREKPKQPRSLPNDPSHCLASMGVYVFRTDFLLDQLRRDAATCESQHDFGRDVIPAVLESDLVLAYSFFQPSTNERGYWRDVGTLDAYYNTSMDILSEPPRLDIFDPHWRVHSYARSSVATLVTEPATSSGYSVRSRLECCLLSPGVRICGAVVERSILSPDVQVDAGAVVVESILLDGVHIGPGARIHRAIIDKYAEIPRETVVGLSAAADHARGFTVTESGLTVVPRGYRVTNAKPDLTLAVAPIHQREPLPTWSI